MEKRGFHLVGSVWWGGVVLEGDPEDDAQLDSFYCVISIERCSSLFLMWLRD